MLWTLLWGHLSSLPKICLKAPLKYPLEVPLKLKVLLGYSLKISCFDFNSNCHPCLFCIFLHDHSASSIYFSNFIVSNSSDWIFFISSVFLAMLCLKMHLWYFESLLCEFCLGDFCSPHCQCWINDTLLPKLPFTCDLWPWVIMRWG